MILAFYPADWSPVCGDQMALYNEMGKYFARHNAQLIGISVDSKWCHLAFREHNKFHFPLLSDFEPKGEVASLYGAYDESTGECSRALYVIDEDGIIRWSYLSAVGINPGADGILNALEEMAETKPGSMNQLTPVNSNDHLLGNTVAPIELVEYGDYECPYCGRAFPIVKDIKQQLGGELRFVFRNFPLSRIHPHAFLAAVATEAAGLQGKFWQMHDIIFENQRMLSEERIIHFAEVLGLDTERFKKDLQQRSLMDKVEQDFESGIRSGVARTPTFFINGIKYEGEWGDGQLLQYLKTMLTEVSFTAA